MTAAAISSGRGVADPTRASTLPAVLVARARATPGRVARREKRLGLWREVTWRDVAARAAAFGAGFRELGVVPGERVAMIVGPGLDAFAADAGLQGIGAVVLSIHPGLAPPELTALLAGADVRVAVVEDAEQLEGLAATAVAPTLRRVLVADTRWLAAAGRSVAMPLATVAEQPPSRAGGTESGWFEAAEALAPDAVAVEAVTVGGSGRPRAVALTHANLTAAVRAATVAFGVRADDELLSYLPPSHVLERVLSCGVAPLVGAVVNVGDGPGGVVGDLTVVEPTVLLGVPGLWARVARVVDERIERAGWANRRALAVGRRRARARLAALRRGRGPGPLAGRLSTRRAASLLGLGRLRVALCALAPLAAFTADALGELGVVLRDCYGTPECCGLATAAPAGGVRAASVGRAVPDTQVRVGPDGVLAIRGPQVAPGAADPEGWLATGDRAVIDDDGFVVLGGAADDELVTAAGARVDARRVARALEADPLIGHAVVTGDRRPHVGALLELDPDALAAWAAVEGITYRTVRDLADLPPTRARLEHVVATANEELPPGARVKVFRVLRAPLVLGRELTLTRRVRRSAAIVGAAPLVEEMYR